MITYTVTPTKRSPYLHLHAQADSGDSHKVTIHPSASPTHLIVCAAYLSTILDPPTTQ